MKTCINLDARAYEFMAEKFPEVAARLKKYLAAGKVELIGGTYGQPMGTTIGGESNIRQMVVGRETIRKALDYEMVTFLEEEEFTHPQIPQIGRSAGFRYASLAQLDTWGRAGCPHAGPQRLPLEGDGRHDDPVRAEERAVRLPADAKQLAASPAFKKLQALGKPLVFTWEEFGWESPEQPAYLTAPGEVQGVGRPGYRSNSSRLQRVPGQVRRPGQGDDLPADGRLEQVAHLGTGRRSGARPRPQGGGAAAGRRSSSTRSPRRWAPPRNATSSDKAWKDLLASQSHDVGLCEYSRWQGDRMAPADRLEDYHNFTWGTIGYNHLDAAQKQGQQVLDAALAHLGRRIAQRGESARSAGGHGVQSARLGRGPTWPRPAASIRCRPSTKDVVVKDRSGRTLPSQIVKSEKDAQGNIIVANVAFPAERGAVGRLRHLLPRLRAAARAAGRQRILQHRRGEADAGERARARAIGSDDRRDRQPGPQAPRAARCSTPARAPALGLPAGRTRTLSLRPQSAGVLRQRQVEGGHRLAGQGAAARRGAGAARHAVHAVRDARASGRRLAVRRGVQPHVRVAAAASPTQSAAGRTSRRDTGSRSRRLSRSRRCCATFPFGIEPTKHAGVPRADVCRSAGQGRGPAGAASRARSGSAATTRAACRTW